MSKGVEQTKAIVQSMIALASAALGLIAALAWNDAMKAAMKELNLGEELPALFLYAVIATVIAVLVVVVLSRIASKVGGEAAISREAEG